MSDAEPGMSGTGTPDAEIADDVPFRELDSQACSIARAAAIIGQPWTVVIMRDLLRGVRRFDDLVDHLGIARTVLTRRLAVLIDSGLVERVAYREGRSRTRHEYRPTRAGVDLHVVLLALMAFGDAHLADGAGPPAVPEHAGCGAPVRLERVCAAGHRLGDQDRMITKPGPGARLSIYSG
jgi:DNA-binding HxlR family transcriptional regulator